MTFNADQTFDFKSASSKRWLTYGEGVLPLWVADMDFAIAEPIVERLKHYLTNYSPVYGHICEEHNQQVCQHIKRRHNWEIEPQWIHWISGVVPGLYASVDGFVNADQSLIVPTPIYPPFLHAAARKQHHFAKATLDSNSQWHWHLPEVQKTDKLLLMCNPHNPIGKAYNRQEIEKIAEYCCQNDLLVCSDEIFADLILDQQRHIPIASLNQEISKRSITLMSAGKAWNIAGMRTAFAIIPDPSVRARFADVLTGISSEPSMLGVIATCTAFSECDAWRVGLLEHMRTNRERLDQAIETMQGISWIQNCATFLAWMRCESNADSHWDNLLKAGLALSKGGDFGDDNYLRLNMGCTSEHLEQAIAILGNEFGKP